MGTAIDSDDGAISVIPLDTPARKETPPVRIMITMSILVLLMVIPRVLALVNIVSDVIAVHW